MYISAQPGLGGVRYVPFMDRLNKPESVVPIYDNLTIIIISICKENNVFSITANDYYRTIFSELLSA